MTTFFVAPDGHGDPTLWMTLGDQLFPVASQSRLNQPSYWDDLVAAVLAGQEREVRACFACSVEDGGPCCDDDRSPE